MTSNKLYWIILATILFSVIVYSQTTNPQTDILFQNGTNYLVTSPNNVWNATDFTAYALLSNYFPQTFQSFNPIMDSKKTFDSKQYPFIFSLLQSQTSNPSQFEIGLGTPVVLNKLYSCEDFSPNDFQELSKKKNTIDFPYEGSHAVLVLLFIKKQYATKCLKSQQVVQADQAIQQALNGLIIPLSPEYFDPYLEQECARGIATGIIKPEVLQLVSSTQDPLNGGWYFQEKKLNPDWEDEIEGKIQVGEYPNGHTSIFALCILATELHKL